MANNTSGTANDKRTVRVPLVGVPNYRGYNPVKDQRYTNVLIEPVKNEDSKTISFYCIKRPGLTLQSYPPGVAAEGRGIYSWQGHLYSVFGNKIYKDGTIMSATLTTSTGLCDFIETSAIAANPYLALNDGTDLWLIKADDTVTKVVDADYPTTNNLGNVIFFDGYTIVAQTNGRIWNSTNEDPATWGALDYTNAQMFPDNLVAIARQNNTLVAFGEWSTQFFYDAALASPGSFMLSLEQGALQIGCASRDSVMQHENFVIWVARAQTGGYTVQRLDGITDLKQISTPAIEKLLFAEGNNISSCSAISFRGYGHFVYLLTLSTRTLCYDIETEHWTEWGAGSFGIFPYKWAIQHNGVPLLQHTTNGKIYTLDPTVFQDDGDPIYVTILTTNYDYNTMYRKFCTRFELVGDRQTSTAVITVQYTDDDYQTFSTARSMDMSKRMWLTRLGQFRRRAWYLSYSDNNYLRLEAIEVDIQDGEQ